MPAHHPRRWPNIGQTLGRCVVFAGLTSTLRTCRSSVCGVDLRWSSIEQSVTGNVKSEAEQSLPREVI